jgi:TRAP-type C4-dicarboxylate transport system permease large subunit
MVVIILGCFIDPLAILLMLGVTLTKVATALDIDAVHFGVIFVLTLTIAVVTPPVGSCMYVSMALAKISAVEYAKATYPFLLALFITLFAIICFPQMVLWLPNLLMG